MRSSASNDSRNKYMSKGIESEATPSQLLRIGEEIKTLEPYLPLAEAVERATGTRPHLSTILRWCTKGARGRRLASAIIGGRRMTTVPAVREFVLHCPGTSSQPLQVARDRSKAIDAAVARLRSRTKLSQSEPIDAGKDVPQS